MSTLSAKGAGLSPPTSVSLVEEAIVRNVEGVFSRIISLLISPTVKYQCR